MGRDFRSSRPVSVRCIPPLPRTAFSEITILVVDHFFESRASRSGERAVRKRNRQGAGSVVTTHHDRRGPSNSRSGREGPSQPAVTCPTHPREPRRLHGPIGKARGNPGEVTHARACAHTHTRALCPSARCAVPIGGKPRARVCVTCEGCCDQRTCFMDHNNLRNLCAHAT